ncbi:MAG: Hpt domain-containing protein [Paracoccaceae bacterium]|nr:MAG: Hpt domain-containing protein [Paracoccaceae bacterium]
MIDWSRLEELTAEIGTDAVTEVVALFLDEADGVAARLPETLPDSVEGELHFLKGAALNLGFTYLAQLCAAGERSPYTADLDAVVECYRQSKDLFLSGISKRAAA